MVKSLARFAAPVAACLCAFSTASAAIITGTVTADDGEGGRYTVLTYQQDSETGYALGGTFSVRVDVEVYTSPETPPARYTIEPDDWTLVAIGDERGGNLTDLEFVGAGTLAIVTLPVGSDLSTLAIFYAGDDASEGWTPYFDNPELSITSDAVPLPGAILFLLTGLGGAAAARRLA